MLCNVITYLYSAP